MVVSTLKISILGVFKVKTKNSKHFDQFDFDRIYKSKLVTQFV